MTLKLFNRKARWLSTLGLVMLMGGACYSQQENRRDDDFFMHQTLAKISGLQPELRSFYRPEGLKNELMMARQSLRSHLEYSDGILKRLQEMTNREEDRQAILDKELENLTAEMKKSTGYSFLPEETVDLLLRNCMVELQRLEWESIGLASDAELNDQSRKMEADLLRLQAGEKGLDAIARRMAAARKELEELSKLVQQGLASSSQLREAESRVADMEAAMEQQELSLEVAKTELQSKASGKSEEAAVKMKGIEQKKAQILKQIDSLQLQKTWSQKASAIRNKSEVASSRIRELEMMMLKYSTKKIEHGVLEEMIRTALDKEKGESSKNE